MNPGFQEGRRPRANAAASLAATGHVSPLARRPGVGATRHAQAPGPASRPGPKPLSARQTAAVNAQNARVRREVEQTLADCKQEIVLSNNRMRQRASSLAFSKYDFDKRRDGTPETIQLDRYHEIDATRYQVGALWVYAATLHDGWGDHVYYIYNPDTGALLEFMPEAAIASKQRLYQSKRTQIQGTAAGTGVAGGYLEKGFAGLALGGFGAAVAVEAGGYYLLTEQVAPLVGRVAVRAYHVARPAVQAYAKHAYKGMAARMGIDFSFQYLTSYVVADPTQGSRASQALSGVNLTQVAGSGLIKGGAYLQWGAKTRLAAKILLASGTAAATNLVTFSRGNSNKYGGYWHMVNFHDASQTAEYVRNVIIGTVVDPLKEGLSGGLAKKLAAGAEQWAAQASGRASQAVLRWVTETRVEMPANFIFGGLVEVPKKLWEQQNEKEEAQRQAQQKAEAQRRAAQQPQPTPVTK